LKVELKFVKFLLELKFLKEEIMARGRKPGKRANRIVRLSIPKRTYAILSGIAGNNEQRLNRLIRNIIEERLNSSTIAELSKLVEPTPREKAKAEKEEEPTP